MNLYKQTKPMTVTMDQNGAVVGAELYEVATPKEIAQAHPKCETCGHWKRHPTPTMESVEDGECAADEHYAHALDYCNNHTEISGNTDADAK